jgi:hypothetical protein
MDSNFIYFKIRIHSFFLISAFDEWIKQGPDEIKVQVLLQLGPGIGIFHTGKFGLVSYSAHG